jgi:acetyltransferase-like isoleucine patch superfamily enzyme
VTLAASAVGAFRRRWNRRIAPRFASFGEGSEIRWPLDEVTEPEHIEIGRNVFIRAHARLEVVRTEAGAPPGHIRIGDDTHIEGYFSVASAASVTIGASVLFGSNVTIRDHDHGIAPERHRARQPLVAAPVVVEDFVWLSQNVVVLKGVTIGRNAVVGASAVVTESIPPGAIAVGIPARVVGSVEDADLG